MERKRQNLLFLMVVKTLVPGKPKEEAIYTCLFSLTLHLSRAQCCPHSTPWDILPMVKSISAVRRQN